VVGSIKKGWNPVRLPSFTSYPTSSVFVHAIPLTLIGFMEAFSMARKYALQYKYEIDINQEAMALGTS
jgi:SulP family sulfate permease